MPAIDAMRNLFTRVSGGYDRVNRALSLGLDILWRARALRLLERESLPAEMAILDLAAGTGDFSIQAAKKFPSSRIVAVDITPAMMEIGKGKVEAEKLSGRISFAEGDAMDLKFGNSSFDCMTCAFGFRNFPLPGKALGEASRILKVGGCVAVLEFFRPPTALASKFLVFWIGIVSAVFARGLTKEYKYLGNSIRNMRTEKDFTEMARGHGLELRSRKFFFPCCSCLVFRKTG